MNGKRKDTKATPAAFAKTATTATAAAVPIVPDLPTTSADVPPAWWGSTSTAFSGASTSSKDDLSRTGPFSFSAAGSSSGLDGSSKAGVDTAATQATARNDNESPKKSKGSSSVSEFSRSIFHDDVFADAAVGSQANAGGVSATPSTSTAAAADRATDGGKHTDEKDRSAFMSGFEDDDDDEIGDDDTNSVSDMNDISDDDNASVASNSSFKDAFRNVDLFGTKSRSSKAREADSDDDSDMDEDRDDGNMDDIDPLADMISPDGPSEKSKGSDKKKKSDPFDKPFEMAQPPVPPVSNSSSVPPPVFTTTSTSFSPGSSDSSKHGAAFAFGLGTNSSAKAATAAAAKPPPPPTAPAASGQPPSSGTVPSASAFSSFKFGPGSSNSSWTPLFGPTAATLAQRLRQQSSQPQQAPQASAQQQQPNATDGQSSSSSSNTAGGAGQSKAAKGREKKSEADMSADDRMAQLAELYRKQGAELYSREDYEKYVCLSVHPRLANVLYMGVDPYIAHVLFVCVFAFISHTFLIINTLIAAQSIGCVR
jgi:hypothetical protein